MKKLVLDRVEVQSFVTCLTGKQSDFMGGLTATNCNFTKDVGCSDQNTCTEYNQCDGDTGCCMPRNV